MEKINKDYKVRLKFSRCANCSFFKPVLHLFLFSRQHWQRWRFSAWRPPWSVYLVSMGSPGYCQTTEEQAWGVWVPVLDGYRSNGRRGFFVCGDWRRDQSLKGECRQIINVFLLVFLVVYQTRKTVFDRISKHLEVREKYSAFYF